MKDHVRDFDQDEFPIEDWTKLAKISLEERMQATPDAFITAIKSKSGKVTIYTKESHSHRVGTYITIYGVKQFKGIYKILETTSNTLSFSFMWWEKGKYKETGLVKSVGLVHETSGSSEFENPENTRLQHMYNSKIMDRARVIEPVMTKAIHGGPTNLGLIGQINFELDCLRKIPGGQTFINLALSRLVENIDSTCYN